MNERGSVMTELMELPREEAHKRLYLLCTGRELNLDTPQDYNEKLQWLMINRYDRNVSRFADKLAVRDYVRGCGFERLLPRLYGVYERAEDIDFDALPREVIIKANHGSGAHFYEIIRDCGEGEPAKETIEKLNKALRLNYWQTALEYHYRYIRPRLYAEELICEDGHNAPTDYKVYCFSGQPRYIKVITDRGCGVNQSYYDTDWNRCEFVKDEYRFDGEIKRPGHLSEMLLAASKLSAPFPTARVDFYDNAHALYFGELTLTPAAGLNRTDRRESLAEFGRLTDIHFFREELLGFARTGEQATLELVSLFGRLLGSTNGHGSLLGELSTLQLRAVMKDACTVLGSDAQDAHKNICLDILYKIAFLDVMTLEECWQIYWNLNRSLFLNHSLKLSVGSLRLLYRHIYSFVHSMISFEEKKPRPVGERSRRIVIITSQFLKPGHAPTTRVLDYGCALRRLGYDILIINDSGMNYYRFPYLDGVADFNFCEAYNEYSTFEYMGESFEFLQLGVRMVNLDALQLLTDNIYELNPLLVYNIGGSCLSADLCSDFVTVASLPCSFAIPVSECQNLLVGRQTDKNDLEELSGLSPHQRVIETNFNYVYHKSVHAYTRSGYGIPQESFLITVVGHRLGTEMNTGFLKMLSRTLKEGANQELDILIAFVGEIEDREHVLAAFDEGVKSRVLFTGAISDAGAFTALSDLNINPDRSGGGRAAFEAMHEGIPVISLRRGDAYYCSGPDFGADDYDKYSRLIIKYCTDSEFYGKMSALAKERAHKLEDIDGTLNSAVERLLG